MKRSEETMATVRTSDGETRNNAVENNKSLQDGTADEESDRREQQLRPEPCNASENTERGTGVQPNSDALKQEADVDANGDKDANRETANAAGNTAAVSAASNATDGTKPIASNATIPTAAAPETDASNPVQHNSNIADAAASAASDTVAIAQLPDAQPASTVLAINRTATNNASANTQSSASAPTSTNKTLFDSRDFAKFLKENDVTKFAFVTRSGSLVSADLEGADPSKFSSRTVAKSTDFWKDSGIFNSAESIKSVELFKSVEGFDPPSLGSEKTAALTHGSATTTAAKAAAQHHLSKEWTPHYQKNHVDINYAEFFRTKSDASKNDAISSYIKDATKPLPPKKRAAIPQAVEAAAAAAAASASIAPANPGTLPDGTSDTKDAATMAAAAAAAVNASHTDTVRNTSYWNSMFQMQLGLSPALIQAAHQATPVKGGDAVEGVAASASTDVSVSDSNSGSKRRSTTATGTDVQQKKRRHRKIIPEVKEFVDKYTDQDILFGRGGRSNHHPGNKVYRELVTSIQAHYRTCDKPEKTRIAQSIVDKIHEKGGRFLELDKETQRWYVVDQLTARRKAGQALRENNTEEARRAKREKYAMGKKSTKVNNMKLLPPKSPAPYYFPAAAK